MPRCRYLHEGRRCVQPALSRLAMRVSNALRLAPKSVKTNSTRGQHRQTRSKPQSRGLMSTEHCVPSDRIEGPVCPVTVRPGASTRALRMFAAFIASTIIATASANGIFNSMDCVAVSRSERQKQRVNKKPVRKNPRTNQRPSAEFEMSTLRCYRDAATRLGRVCLPDTSDNAPQGCRHL